uniref:Agelaiatoxin-8 n=1 Tax=Agelaia vicina TaxID=2724002 RepID=MAST8_AGEVI|nr:RecName: Full=Agelaiatoxin-8; Short=AVTx8 [Agelaia vicina]
INWKKLGKALNALL